VILDDLTGSIPAKQSEEIIGAIEASASLKSQLATGNKFDSTTVSYANEA
jgi:hypothetical protein